MGILIVILMGLATEPNLRAGTIAGWGNDSSGLVSQTPKTGGFSAISTGDSHGVALSFDGSIMSWSDDPTSRVVVKTPKGTGFTAVVAGSRHSLALRSDSSIVAWGQNSDGQVSGTPKGTGFIAIAGGTYHSLALRSDGSIVSWGPRTAEVSGTPQGTGFTAIAGGFLYSLALRSDGSIATWGYNPVFVLNQGPPAGTGFTAIAAGGNHGLALRTDGSIAAWGDDSSGQVSGVPTGTDFIAIAAGYDYSLALRSNGSIVGWGNSFGGQVSGAPTGSGFTAIAAGADHGLALTSSKGVDTNQPLMWGQVDMIYHPDFLIAAAWGGKSKYSVLASSRLANVPPGIGKAAYCLLNFDNAAPSLPGGWQNGAWQVQQAIDAVGPTQLALLKFMAIDVELEPVENTVYLPLGDYARVQRIGEAIQATLDVGLQPIIYSARRYWMPLTNNTTAFKDFGLWDIKVIAGDGSLTMDGSRSWQPYGGWVRRVGRQYDQNLPVVPTAGLVDLNVFDPAVFLGAYIRPSRAVEISANWWSGASPDAEVLVTGSALTVRITSRIPYKDRRQGYVTLKNIGNHTISGPLQLVLSHLTPGYTLSNAIGDRGNGPYLILPLPQEGLAPGGTCTTQVLFESSTTEILNYVPKIYSGYW